MKNFPRWSFIWTTYPRIGSTRISAVVEKCSDGGSDGGLIYDVTFSKGKAKPEVVFEADAHVIRQHLDEAPVDRQIAR